MYRPSVYAAHLSPGSAKFPMYHFHFIIDFCRSPPQPYDLVTLTVSNSWPHGHLLFHSQRLTVCKYPITSGAVLATMVHNSLLLMSLPYFRTLRVVFFLPHWDVQKIYLASFSTTDKSNAIWAPRLYIQEAGCLYSSLDLLQILLFLWTPLKASGSLHYTMNGSQWDCYEWDM